MTAGNNFYDLPVSELTNRIKRTLVLNLNPRQIIVNKNQMAPDWTGLAELLGFCFLEIQNFEQHNDPTGSLLAAYGAKAGSNVGIILEKLEELERRDILTEIMQLVEEAADSYHNRLIEQQHQKEIDSLYSAYGNTPAQALSSTTWNILCVDLAAPSPIRINGNLPCDGRGLIHLLRRNKKDQSEGSESDLESFLKKWAAKDQLNTVSLLLKCLYELQRWDVIEDIKPSLDADVQRHSNIKAGQDSGELLTVGDKAGEREQFDAYVSYCEEDLPFVERMIRVLEKKYKLKLLIPERDLIFGDSAYEITAQVIEERCRRTLIVLSPEYIGSPQCQFEIRYASSLSPDAGQQKIIPIIIKPCRVPRILQFMAMLNYTRPQFQRWFWKRLCDTIKSKYSTGSWEHESPQTDLRSIALSTTGGKNAIKALKRSMSEPHIDRPWTRMTSISSV